MSQQRQPLEQTPELEETLRRLGLVRPGEGFRVTPLTGGVSSDIWRVEAGGRRFCVKRALAKLKVAALGRRRSSATRRRRLIARGRRAGCRAPSRMCWPTIPKPACSPWTTCRPNAIPLWKAELLAGRVDRNFAAAVGRAWR